uniref:G-protein coupled receptors family 1 profile domain-containing protein n=1 Tax=Xenopus tropicalis TaxID=8364 RepID=A0A1B8Y4A6_XENTR
MNSSVPSINTTQGSVMSNRTSETVRMTFLILSFLCFGFFIYLVAIILYIFLSNAQVRESARYVLFAHILVNDLLYLSVGFYLLVITLASCTFWVTPYNLALMSLERYVAICHPLRHTEICSGHRLTMAIALMWTLGLTPNVADFITFSLSANKRYFSLHVICSRESLTVNPTQNTIRSNVLVITVSLVALIILYTYIKVMLVARKVGSGTSSAIKAGKTVLLHGVQLLLSLMSLITSYIEANVKEYVVLLAISNFLFFMCLPRFLGPLIYGLRDEVFGKHLRKLHSVCIEIR